MDLKAVKLPGPVEKKILENTLISNFFKHLLKISKILSILLLIIFFSINLTNFFSLNTANEIVWLEEKRDSDNISFS